MNSFSNFVSFIYITGMFAVGFIVASMLVANTEPSVVMEPMQFTQSIYPRPLPQTTVVSNRTLVVILSETRSHKSTFESFHQHVLQPMGDSVDLALCVADKSPEDDNPFYKHAKYIWTLPDMANWADAIEWIARVHYNDYSGRWRKVLDFRDQFMGGVVDPDHYQHPGSAGILLVMRWFLMERLRPHLEDYQWFMVTRSDYYYVAPMVPFSLLDPEAVWLPNNANIGDFTDREFVSTSKYLNAWLDFIHVLITDPESVFQRLRWQNRQNWNLENILLDNLRAHGITTNIKRYHRSSFAVREEGGMTRWSKGDWDETMKLYIKYKHDEYEPATTTMEMLKARGGWKSMNIEAPWRHPWM